MKTLYFLFCYILLLFVFHGWVIDLSTALTFYHRTEIPMMVIMCWYIIKKFRNLPIKIINKYIIPIFFFVLLILFGSLFHENTNILQIMSGFVFFLIVWIYSFIAGFNNPDYLKTYKDKIFLALVIMGGVGIFLELKATFLYNITRDADIRGYSYNCAPFMLAYLIPLSLLFRILR